MNNDTFYEILEQVEHRSYLKSEDIPSIDLYMDQIMTLFDIHLENNKRFENDKLLTKTMINNYSKEGILKPIKGKKYSYEEYDGSSMFMISNLININDTNVKTRFYFDSKNNLTYIKTILDNKQELLKVTLEKDVKDSIFEIPSDYAEN